MSNKEIQRCPHCGLNLNPDERMVYKFSSWTTTFMVFIISLMLFAMDFVDNGTGFTLAERLDWAYWAIIGLWIFFISVQLIRYQPNYTWLMIPVSGILFSAFLVAIDLGTGNNEGYLGLDWAWYAVIPVITFIVILPIVARVFRQEPSHYDRLEYLVEFLAEEQK